MKLLVLHVSEHRDEHIVRPIWDRIFEDGKETLFVELARLTPCSALEKDADAQTHADHIIASVVPLGKRFYPSESAFPLRKSTILASQRHMIDACCRIYRDPAYLFLVAEQGTTSKRLGSSSFGSMRRATRRNMGCFT